jgi:hypothetical protein
MALGRISDHILFNRPRDWMLRKIGIIPALNHMVNKMMMMMGLRKNIPVQDIK